jgi:hypothetical protein
MSLNNQTRRVSKQTRLRQFIAVICAVLRRAMVGTVIHQVNIFGDTRRTQAPSLFPIIVRRRIASFLHVTSAPTTRSQTLPNLAGMSAHAL